MVMMTMMMMMMIMVKRGGGNRGEVGQEIEEKNNKIK